VLASRNLQEVHTIEAAKLNVLDLLNYKYLLLPVKAIANIPHLENQNSSIAANPSKVSKLSAK